MLNQLCNTKTNCPNGEDEDETMCLFHRPVSSVKCDFNYLNLPLLAGPRSFKTSLKFMRAQLSSCGSAVDSSHLIVSILVLHVLETSSF